MRLTRPGLLFWWLTLALLGCGPDPNAPEMAPVEGTVYLNDRPLANATVTFTPTGSTRGVVSTGHTGADGRYTLKTVRRQDGAAIGTHRVVINKLELPDGSSPAPDAGGPMDTAAKEALPGRYSSAERTTLTATVKANGGPIDFRLTSDPKGK
jgi:hypothetical protein